MSNQLTEATPAILTHGEAAEMARMSEANLYYLNSMGKGPKRGKLGKRLMYRRGDVEAWLDSAFEGAV